MKTNRNLRFVMVAACALLMGGCATPESRIKAQPDVFARLAPDQQALVKAGKVAPGFDMGAVRLALGDPDRVTVETNASGSHEIWRYVTYETEPGALYLDGFYTPYNVVGGPYFMSVSGFGSAHPAFPGRQWGDLSITPNLALYPGGSSHERAYELTRVVFDTHGLVALVRQRNP